MTKVLASSLLYLLTAVSSVLAADPKRQAPVDQARGLQRDDLTPEARRRLERLRRASRQRAAEVDHWRQSVMFFASGLAREVDTHDAFGAKRMRDMLDEWKRKVLELEEFGGTEVTAEWSPVEQRLLALLRRARDEIPLFTERFETTGVHAQVRSKAFRRFLRPGQESEFPRDVREQIPPTSRVSNEDWAKWQKIDPTPYRQVVAELQVWLDDWHEGNVTPEMLADEVLRIRSHFVIVRLATEMRERMVDAPKKDAQRLDDILDQDVLPMVTFGTFDAQRTSDGPLGDTNGVQGALRFYLRTARKLHPVFERLDRDLSWTTMMHLDNRLRSEGRPAELQEARRRLVNVLEQAARQQPMASRPPASNKDEPPPHTEPAAGDQLPSAATERHPSGDAASPWLWLVAGVLSVAAVAGFVIRRNLSTSER